MIKYTSIPHRTLLLKFILFDKKRSLVTKDDCDEDVHNQSNIRTSQSNRLARHGSTKPHFGNSYSVYRHQALKTTSKWRTGTPSKNDNSWDIHNLSNVVTRKIFWSHPDFH